MRQLAETKTEVFFTIGSSAVRDTEEGKLRDFAQWMKNHPTAKAEVMGYADAGTGNAEINRKCVLYNALTETCYGRRHNIYFGIYFVNLVKDLLHNLNGVSL